MPIILVNLLQIQQEKTLGADVQEQPIPNYNLERKVWENVKAKLNTIDPSRIRGHSGRCK